jgi:hypothetical protein
MRAALAPIWSDCRTRARRFLCLPKSGFTCLKRVQEFTSLLKKKKKHLVGVLHETGEAHKFFCLLNYIFTGLKGVQKTVLSKKKKQLNS